VDFFWLGSTKDAKNARRTQGILTKVLCALRVPFVIFVLQKPNPQLLFIYFQPMNYISLNGNIIPGDQPVLSADNRGYRYGDGIFETIKMVREKISLQSLHFERFFSGLELLQLTIPPQLTEEKLAEQILDLCQQNHCCGLSRIRLSAFGGNGGLYDDDRSLHYLVESWPLTQSVNQLNEKGLVIDIYPEARKTCDSFSNLKSANYLPSVMGARHAKHHQLNDCLILNSNGRIAESTIANVFLVNGQTIITPSLEEGCVAGVMRRYLLGKFRVQSSEFRVMEEAITVEQVMDANEVFLTNALSGISWVKNFRNKTYTNSQTVEIYNRFIKTIWE
jgi:branched-chain amino acid aminotransferase